MNLGKKMILLNKVFWKVLDPPPKKSIPLNLHNGSWLLF